MFTRTIGCRVTVVAALCASVAGSNAWAQTNPKPLVQLEVADSIGLPLPDAKLELFTLLQGGIVNEWVALDPAELPEGTDLIRVSRPGYVSVVFSVPVQAGSRVALRVRLNPAHDTTAGRKTPEADEIHAKGFAISGAVHTDVIGSRRVLDRTDLERGGVPRLGAFLARAHGTDLKILPTAGGSFRPYSPPPRRGAGGGVSQLGPLCVLQVMLNGDRRRILPFDAADQLVAIDEIETIEIFPRGFLPAAYSAVNSALPGPGEVWCGLLVVWTRAP